jgi:CubicO group peptidase (beta-lactamase class C family)
MTIATADMRRTAPAALFRQLDAKVRAAMGRYAIPGVAVAVLYRGTEYVRGCGVTNVDYPVGAGGH